MSLRVLTAAVSAAVLAGAAQSPASAQSGGSLDAFYPPAARAAGLTGYVMLDCLARDDGALVDCRVIQESPQGHGFGKASLEAARTFKMKVRTQNGDVVEGANLRVKIPIRWNLDRTPRPAGTGPR
jgi:TonB family protein